MYLLPNGLMSCCARHCAAASKCNIEIMYGGISASAKCRYAAFLMQNMQEFYHAKEWFTRIEMCIRGGKMRKRCNRVREAQKDKRMKTHPAKKSSKEKMNFFVF